jgi:phage gpG-like protein
MPRRGAVQIEMVPNATIIGSQFRDWGGQIGRFQEPLQVAIDNVVAPSIATNFSVGGRPAWAPLLPQTLERRLHSAPPLTDTGLLRDVGSSPSIWTVRNDRAFIPSAALGGAVYGAIHQSGSSRMAARPWAVLQPQDVAQIQEIMGDWAGVTASRAGVIAGVRAVFGRAFGRRR